MKAVVCVKYGGPEGLQLREVEKPAPKDNQVRVKVFASTVTAGDAKLRSLSLPLRLVFLLTGVGGVRRNSIPGHELAGEIEAVGTAVKRFKQGDRVFASTGMRAGAHAEYVCLPEGAMMAPKPDNLTYEQAAAVPVGGNTALCLLRQADIQPGQKVLIYGASGSVGTYAVQLARYYGAEVTGVCSTANLDMMRSLGASYVIDYTRQDFASGDRTYDLIFDAVGKTSASHCKAALGANGRLLSVLSPTSEETENLIFLKELIEAGELRPVIDRRYPLEQIVAAHQYVDSGHKRGNVVITVIPEDQA